MDIIMIKKPKLYSANSRRFGEKRNPDDARPGYTRDPPGRTLAISLTDPGYTVRARMSAGKKKFKTPLTQTDLEQPPCTEIEKHLIYSSQLLVVGSTSSNELLNLEECEPQPS